MRFSLLGPLHVERAGQDVLPGARKLRALLALLLLRRGETVSVDELGLEPSRPLRELERAILGQTARSGGRGADFLSRPAGGSA